MRSPAGRGDVADRGNSGWRRPRRPARASCIYLSFKTTSTDTGMSNWLVLLKDSSRWGYPRPMAFDPAKPEKKIAQ